MPSVMATLSHTNLTRPNLTLQARAIPSDQVMLQRAGTESVLLDLASEHYFGLNEVGTRIWELLLLDPSLRNTLDILLAEFDVAPEKLEQDLLSLTNDLAHAGLVTLE